MSSLPPNLFRIAVLATASITQIKELTLWRYENQLVELPYSWNGREVSRLRLSHTFDLPQTPSSTYRRYYLFVDTNVEGLLYIDGEPYHGIDSMHREIPIYRSFKNLELVLISRSDLGRYVERPILREVVLLERDIRVYDLARALYALAELYHVVESTKLRNEIAVLIEDVLDMVRVESIQPYALKFLWREVASHISEYHGVNIIARALDVARAYGIEKLKELGLREVDVDALGEAASRAHEYLRERLNALAKEFGKHGLLHAYAHSHIDYMWLWSTEVFNFKLGKTMATSLTLLRAFPEMRFWITSAHYIELLRERYPQLFQELYKCISSDRCLLVGGFWTEFDANLIEGESIARQYLYGQRYLKKMFNKTARATFLPDTFGFPPSLPQILRKSGIEVFIGRKLSWNEYNKFPHLYFAWVGIDGTEIPAIMMDENHWALAVDPKKILGAWESNTEYGLIPVAPYIYGYGDGGGGPTEEHLLRLAIYSLTPSTPRIEHGDLEKFLNLVIEHKTELPKWFGELYLENHRGTYSVGIEIKQLLHSAVTKLKNCEALIAMLYMFKERVPAEVLSELRTLWLRVLEHQFHDIAASTISTDAYEETIDNLTTIVKKLDTLEHLLLSSLAGRAKGKGFLIVNRHPWKYRALITLRIPSNTRVCYRGKPVPIQLLNSGIALAEVELPAFGFKVLELCTDTDNKVESYDEPIVKKDNGIFILENTRLRIEINEYGELVSVYDKDVGREVLAGKSNVMLVFEDRPRYWDAWNIDEDYERRFIAVVRNVERAEIVEKGPLRACVEFVKRFRNSKIVQKICLQKDSKLIWFFTEADWRERHVLLKTEFNLDINAHEVFVEVPLGNYARPIHRNTSWERAKFEMWYSRWIDLSEYNYGVTFISTSSTHGFDAYFRRIRLTLIKSPIGPTPLLSSGKIVVNYIMFPHMGTWREASIPRLAYELDEPPMVYEIQEDRSGLEEVELINVEPSNIAVEAIKPCEDEDSCIVLRMFESNNSRTHAKVATSWKCFETDILEEKLEETRCEELEFRPYEIKSIVIKLPRDEARNTLL